MPDVPTLLFVHAHPDDEASTTGGTIAAYAAAGARVVLVTCTDGELGDSPRGHAPDHDEHDSAEVVAHRAEELAESCRILGIARSVRLGYHDSGMMGWPQNDDPAAFWQLDVAVGGARLGEIIAEERPAAVVTYDENGFYGHPDHIQANRITRAALEAMEEPPPLFYATIPRSAFEHFNQMASEAGVELPDDEGDDGAGEGGMPPGSPDEIVGVEIDVSAFTAVKRAALAAHASQTESSFFLQLPEEVFGELFGREWFVAVGREGEPVRSELLDAVL